MLPVYEYTFQKKPHNISFIIHMLYSKFSIAFDSGKVTVDEDDY